MTSAANLGTWQDWVRQQLIFTEALRGGPLVWPAGSTHLAGDPLGPVRHAHDDAAEYYYVLSGACLVEVGGEERVANTGDLVYIPANAPHNLLHEVGGEDAWVYVLVSPNFAHNKWRTSDYLPGTESLRMTITRPLDGDDSAASNPFPASLVTVRARRAAAGGVAHAPSSCTSCSRASATCASAGCPARSGRAARCTSCATSTTS